MRTCVLGLLLVMLWFLPVLADQRVSVPVGEGETVAAVREKGFAQALSQELQTMVVPPLSPSRLKAVMGVLTPEQGALVRGYSEVAPAEGNATEKTLTLDVRVNTAALKTRLRELGVMSTATAPRPYVLQLSGVEPSRTKRLAHLQELSGLKPVPAAGEDVPVLKLSQAGAWTGELHLGALNATHTAKTLDEVWLAVWKHYFSRAELPTADGSTLSVRVSGWLSSMGPMEFDRLMDSWEAEIVDKSLVGVEMEGAGMVGVWRIQARSREALSRRLADAVKAQGLALEIR